MSRKGWIVSLTIAAALIPVAGYLAWKKCQSKKGPIAILDVDAVAEKSLPGKAASQHLRTVKNILQRNVDEVKKQYEGKLDSPEAIRAIGQAQSTYQQQVIIYQRKLDEEMKKLIAQAVHTWLTVHTDVKTVIPTDETVGYNGKADITEEIMNEIQWYKPSFPPMPRRR